VLTKACVKAENCGRPARVADKINLSAQLNEGMFGVVTTLMRFGANEVQLSSR
jgi:hypothetical protein